MATDTSYTDQFYEQHTDGSLRAARAVVPILQEMIRPTSVIDVGCGTGEWLSEFARHGVEDVVGIDGDYVRRDRLLIPVDRFRPADLSRPLTLERKFDLAVSLEVAEHLPETLADAFVGALTTFAPAVLFSAAVPWQGGTDHVNEQYLEYWAVRFAERGYTSVDCVRPRIWREATIPVWYVQNTVLYVAQSAIERHHAIREEVNRRPDGALSMIHPRMYDFAADPRSLDLRRVGLRRVLSQLPGLVANSVLGRVRRLR